MTWAAACISGALWHRCLNNCEWAAHIDMERGWASIVEIRQYEYINPHSRGSGGRVVITSPHRQCTKTREQVPTEFNTATQAKNSVNMTVYIGVFVVYNCL